MSKTTEPAIILMADDDPEDCLLIGKALQGVPQPTELRCVNEGDELLRYLRRQGEWAGTPQAPTPGLILLDLNMPGKDGRESLEEIRADPLLRSIPVVVLTTSDSHHDVNRAYELGANSYVTKPAAFHDLVRLMHDLTTYWFRTVRLPLAS